MLSSGGVEDKGISSVFLVSALEILTTSFNASRIVIMRFKKRLAYYEGW